MITGCISLPKFSAAPPAPPTDYTTLAAPPAKGKATAPAPAKPIPPPTPAQSAVQKAIHTEVVFFWIAGMLCLAACGFFAYGGQIVPAVKVGIAGIVLPVFATWFDYHSGILIAGILISCALAFLWGVRNTTVALDVETFTLAELVDAKNKIESLFTSAKAATVTATPAPTAPAPATVNVVNQTSASTKTP